MTKKYISLLTIVIFIISSITACTISPVYNKSNSHTSYEHKGKITVGDKVHIITDDEKKHVFVVKKITNKEYIGEDDSVKFSEIKVISKLLDEESLAAYSITTATILTIILIPAFVKEFVLPW